MVASLAAVAILGLNLGVDFRGGILIEIQTREPADLADLRSRLGGLGLGEVTLQEFGAETDVLINVRRQEGDEKAQIKAIEAVKTELGDLVDEYRRVEFVGPKVGDELKQAGALATILALAGIGIYIWFRFEWQFAAAALVALIHDVLSTIGFFALTQIEFNLATLAAVLTIAGYSINDTVVLFDRVRETLRKYKKLAMFDLLNLAINATLSRTVLTSVTTLLALTALFLFGGQVIRGFTAGLIWGVVIGTYSSIGLAVPLLSFVNLRGTQSGAEEEKAKKAGATEAPAENA
jgi:preprotein translocase SecF subunit